MSLFRWSDYNKKWKNKPPANQKNYMKKTKLPTTSKTKVQYCRNCNCKNPDGAKTCSQCEVVLREPKLRRKMK